MGWMIILVDDQFSNLPLPSGNNSRTLACWVKLNNRSEQGSYRMVLLV